MLTRFSVVLAGAAVSVAGLVLSGTGGVAAAPVSASTTFAPSQSPIPSQSPAPSPSNSASAGVPQPSRSSTPSASVTCTMAPSVRPVVTGATTTTLTISFFVYGGLCGNSLPVRFTVHERNVSSPVAEAKWEQSGSGVLTFAGLTPDTEYEIRTAGSSVVVLGRTASAAASCTATVKIDNSWIGGFVATVSVRNVGTEPLDGWRVSWPGSGDQNRLIWNAVEESADGTTVTVRNAAYNAVVAVGGSTTFGMMVWPGPTPANIPATCGR